MGRAHRNLFLSIAVVAVAAGGFLWSTRSSAPDAQAMRPDAQQAVAASGAQAAMLDGAERAFAAQDGSARATVDRVSDLAAAAGPLRALELKLVEALTGKPVAGALARLSAGEITAEATSDDAGLAHLEWPLELAAALEVVSERYVDVRRPTLDLEGPGEIGLVRSGAIAGRVDARSRGAETGPARLWVYSSGNYRGEPVAEATIDENGRFGFADLAPGSYAVGITPRNAPTTFESGVLVSEGLTAQVFLGMTSGVMLRGRVVRARTGEPLAGVVVSSMPELQGINDDVERLAGSETTSGLDGSFEFEGLPIGQVDLTMRTPWGSLATRKENITPDGAGRVRTIGIIGPALIAGRVVDLEGQAVAGVPVVALREGDARSLDWSTAGSVTEGERVGAVLRTVSDVQGRFEFAQVQAAHPIYVVALPEQVSGGPQLSPVAVRVKDLRDGQVKTDVELRLVPGLPLAGTVVNPEGVPVAGVAVEVRARVGRVWAPLPGTVSGVDGGFSFSSVPATDLDVRAELEGHQTARERLRLQPETKPIELQLIPTWRVRGHVVDALGNAVPGAWVRATQQISEDDTRRSTAACDEFGRFVFESLGDGDWTLEGHAAEWRTPRGSAPVVSLPGDPFVSLLMEPEASPPPGTITGELVWAGTGGPLPGLRFDGMRGGSVTLDGTRFKISGVRPGKLQLVAKAEGMEAVGFGVVQLSPGGFVDLGRHEVRRVGMVRVKVSNQQGQEVKAKVLLARLPEERGGRPRGSERVVLRYDRRGKQYYMNNVARYRWELVVVNSKYETLRQEITVQDAAIEVTLQAKAKKKPKGGG